MSQRNQKTTEEEFDLWLKTKFIESFWMRGHRFEKTKTEEIRVDNALFSKEEAIQLFKMLTSHNPFTMLNATLAIWERNGTLLKLLLITAFLLLLIVYIRVRK